MRIRDFLLSCMLISLICLGCQNKRSESRLLLQISYQEGRSWPDGKITDMKDVYVIRQQVVLDKPFEYREKIDGNEIVLSAKLTKQSSRPSSYRLQMAKFTYKDSSQQGPVWLKFHKPTVDSYGAFGTWKKQTFLLTVMDK